MGRQHMRQNGYTLVEIIFVVAISSLMLVGVFQNANLKVSDRQYREGVELFRDFIAAQFEDVMSVKNNRTTTDHFCEQKDKNTSVGQSECIYAGKLLKIKSDSDSTNIESFPVLALVSEPGFASDGSYAPPKVQDIKIMTDDPNVLDFKSDWSVAAYYPFDSSINRVGQSGDDYILIVKHPVSGYTRSYNYTTKEGDNGQDVVKKILESDTNATELITTSHDRRVDWRYKNHLQSTDNVKGANAKMYFTDRYICLQNIKRPDNRDEHMAIKLELDAADASGITIETIRPFISDTDAFGNDGKTPVCRG